MMKARFIKQDMIFREAGGTSRGVLHTKPSWFIQVQNEDGQNGVGECSIIPGLSYDDRPELENKIGIVCKHVNDYATNFHESLKEWPAIRFALETALKGIERGHAFELFEGDFTKGKQPIVINGLIWMGNAETMLQRIKDKLQLGFSCLKLKIGAIGFQQEMDLLRHIRRHYSASDLELRVDANGAFAPEEALSQLDALSKLDIHSIEQPIRAGQHEDMYRLCRQTPLPIALDEELIGVNNYADKKDLLSIIQPQYIILKPSLLGGLKASDEWVELAEANGVNWWATSALEANVGLNAIVQWVAGKNNPLRQGLGTGQVFTNNIISPLYLQGEELFYNPNGSWENPFEH